MDEVDEMDKYKNNLILERFGMEDRIEDWGRYIINNIDIVESLLLIIRLDYAISEHTQVMASMIYSWTKRLDDILEDANHKHFDQKINIEDNLLKEVKEKEKEQEET